MHLKVSFICEMVAIETINLVMIGHAPDTSPELFAAVGLGNMIQNCIASRGRGKSLLSAIVLALFVFGVIQMLSNA